MSSLIGPYDWAFNRSREGHRTYNIWWLVEADNVGADIDDPSVIINTPGLPDIGSLWTDLTWITGSDDWAFCTPEAEVSPHEAKAGEPPLFYLVKNTFSTFPLERCQDATIENPLLEPHEIGGNWVNKRRIPHQDRNGLPYRSSTGEPLMGSETEVDDSDWDLSVGFNSISLPLSLVNSLRHRLNDAPIWGLPAETVKFSNYSFTRRLYGKCNFYYKNDMKFSIRSDWTQYLADKGRMEFIGSGTGTGDYGDPDNWVVAKDRLGENLPMMRLDVSGKPVLSDSQTPGTIVRRPYFTGNLLLLGIPAVL
jgi:hypothetical protein